MHPHLNSNDLSAKLDHEWLEVSVCGAVFTLNDSRLNSPLHTGPKKNTFSNVLKDGTLIDLCGATLMWRSFDSLARTADKSYLDLNLKHLNKTRPQCPVGLKTLVFPTSASPLLLANSQQNERHAFHVVNANGEPHHAVSASGNTCNLNASLSSSLNSTHVMQHLSQSSRGRSRNPHHHTSIWILSSFLFRYCLST